MNTEIIRAEMPDAETYHRIEEAGAALRAGALVVFPTETLYGLGGNGLDKTASARIYKAKGRPSDNPLILHVAEPEEADQFAVVTPVFRRLARAFMPGPLTVVLQARESVPRTVTAGLPTVAVRCPIHPVARHLIRAAGVPVAAPSANLSGSPSPTCAAHVIADLCSRVEYIIDGGDCEIGLESTIVKEEPDGALTLLRPGAVTPEMLREVVDEVRISDAVRHPLKPGQTVLSPGMKYRHYAPKAPLILLKGTPEQRLGFYRAHDGEHTVILAYEEEIQQLRQSCRAVCLSVGAQAHQEELAHVLFAMLRRADELGAQCIYAPLPEDAGIGLALYNRMIRAAAFQVVQL